LLYYPEVVPDILGFVLISSRGRAGNHEMGECLRTDIQRAMYLMAAGEYIRSSHLGYPVQGELQLGSGHHVRCRNLQAFFTRSAGVWNIIIGLHTMTAERQRIRLEMVLRGTKLSVPSREGIRSQPWFLWESRQEPVRNYLENTLHPSVHCGPYCSFPTSSIGILFGQCLEDHLVRYEGKHDDST
jgi:hypothetical protein